MQKAMKVPWGKKYKKCPCGPLGPCAGPHGPPWALMGRAGPLWAGPLWAGPLWAGSLWAPLGPYGPVPYGPGSYGPGPYGPPWAIMGHSGRLWAGPLWAGPLWAPWPFTWLHLTSRIHRIELHLTNSFDLQWNCINIQSVRVLSNLQSRMS